MSKLYAVLDPKTCGDETYRGKSPKSAASKILTQLVKSKGKDKSFTIRILEINNDHTPVLTKTDQHKKVFQYEGSWDATPTVILFGSREVMFDGKPVLHKSKKPCFY
jgi:hypothetical protein